MRLFFLSALFLLSACQKDRASVNLEWGFTDDEVVYSSLVSEPITLDDRFVLHAPDVIKDENLKKQVIDYLRNISFPPGNLDFSVKKISGEKLTIEGVATFPEGDLSGVDEMRLEYLKAREGNLELQADINRNGELLTFFIPQVQRNVVSVLFRLPDENVAVGDTWEIPLNLLSVGAGFVSKDYDSTYSVSLEALTRNKDGDQIAQVFYAINEMALGRFQSPYSETDIPMDSKINVFGLGYFNVTGGFWEKLYHVNHISVLAGHESEEMVVYKIEKK